MRTVTGLFTLILITALLLCGCSSSETTITQDTEPITPAQDVPPPPTVATGTKGIVNYMCRWPGDAPNTAIIKYDSQIMYCSQPTCQMSSKDVVGAVPPGIKVISQGGTELVKVKVLNGHHTGSSGFLSAECVDWGSDGTHLTGAPAEQTATIESGTLADRKAYAKQVVRENEESLQYSGFHGRVTVDGPNGTTMQYYDPDVSATTVTGDTDFIAELRKRGFRKLVFRDGTGLWDVDLSKDPAIPVAR